MLILLFAFFLNVDFPYNMLTEISFLQIVNITILTLISSLMNGYRIKYFGNIFGFPITFKQSYALATSNSMVNIVSIGQSGLILKAYYLKKVFKFKYAHFLSMTGATFIIQFLVYSILGLISLTIGHIESVELWLIFGMILIGIISILMLPTTKFPVLKNKYYIKATEIIKGWNDFKQRKKEVLFLALFEVVYILVGSIRLMYAFSIVGSSVDFVLAIIIITASSLSIIINVVNWLGFGEVFAIWTASLLNLGVVTPLNVILFVKMVSVFVYVVTGTYFLNYTLKELKGVSV